MQSIEYTISVLNANDTIDRMLRSLSERNVKLKRSDLKEVLTELLSLKTSNELDAKIKAHKKTCEALSIFDKNGSLKGNPRVVLKRFKSGAEAHKFFHKYQGFKSVIFFEESFTSESDFQYEIGDMLFSVDALDAAQVLLNWDQNAKLEYVLNTDVERNEYCRDGHWEFELSGDDLFEELDIGPIRMELYTHECDAPDSNIKKLEMDIFEDLSELDLPFGEIQRYGCKQMIQDWLLEDFNAAYTKVADLASYKQLIERFAPYFQIQDIAELQSGVVPADYLATLKDFGAYLETHTVLLNAAAGCQVESCECLLDHGNSIDAFYRVDLSESHRCAMHDHLSDLVEARKPNEVIAYLTTLKEIRVDINHRDDDGETALHVVAEGGSSDLYKRCVKLGCDTTIFCDEGLTPKELLNIAIARKRTPSSSKDNDQRVCH